MIQKIISNLRETSNIVLAAQSLVNEQFNINTELLSANKKKRSLFNHKLSLFNKAIQDSTFLSAEEKFFFTSKMPVEEYQLIREIILELTKKEIKNPLAK